MERMRRDCSVGSDYRAVGARISWLLAAVATTSCAAPRSTPAPTARVETAPSIAELEASLRRDAAAERDEDPVNGPVTPVRVVSFANILGDATDRVTTAPSTIQGDPRDALAEAARRRVDLAIAPISVTTSGGSISREATRGYLAGRTAIRSRRSSRCASRCDVGVAWPPSAHLRMRTTAPDDRPKRPTPVASSLDVGPSSPTIGSDWSTPSCGGEPSRTRSPCRRSV